MSTEPKISDAELVVKANEIMQRAVGEVLALVALHVPTSDDPGEEVLVAGAVGPRNGFAYTEEEVAEIFRLTPRALADQRRRGMLKGSYSRVGRNVFYTPEHVKTILELFSCDPRSKAAKKGGRK
jgi:hypothetical protein